jgi:signal transduction histidine kinase
VPSFIIEHIEEILAEWDAFASTQSPAADTMDLTALRDHAKQMLETIARDIETSQSPEQQALKSKGLGPSAAGHSAAAAHGALRQQVGFDLGQLVAEFRALRASVLRIWLASERYGDKPTANEIARFNEAIDQALAESIETYSAELARSRDTFLGILGHDLRTPLAAMWGAVEILAKSKNDGNRASAYGAANRSLAAMGAMIRDLLDFTRTRLGKGIPVAPDTADLEQVCKASIAEMTLAHPSSTYELACQGRMDALFDRERMHQVVSNLLGNAVQHGEPGAPVRILAGVEEHTIWLKVTNRGPQIPEAMLQTIFDPLVQAAPEDASPRRATNMGLGLFIAREIVHAHGGTIAAESEPTGTTFAVRFPHRRMAATA